MTFMATGLCGDAEQCQLDRRAMLSALKPLESLTDRALVAGGERAVARYRSRGKLPARERVDLLLDEDAPFLEVFGYAGAQDLLEHPSGRLITGIRLVSGAECTIIANQPTINGGSLTPVAMASQLRALDVAESNRLPVVMSVESGGADHLPRQADIFVPGGRTFRELTRRTAAGIPTTSLVSGSSTASGAFLRGMSQYTVLVKEAAPVDLGRPPLVKMAMNEDIDDESLGGAEMHARVSRLATTSPKTSGMRSVWAVKLSRTFTGQGRTGSHDACRSARVRRKGIARLCGGRREAAHRGTPDPRRILDGPRFNEFKPLYGTCAPSASTSPFHGYRLMRVK